MYLLTYAYAMLGFGCGLSMSPQELMYPKLGPSMVILSYVGTFKRWG